MPIILDNVNIWVAKNKIFYTTVNASQMRGFIANSFLFSSSIQKDNVISITTKRLNDAK